MDDEKDEAQNEQEDFDDSEIGIPIGEISMPSKGSEGREDAPIEPEERIDMSQESDSTGGLARDRDNILDMLQEPDQKVHKPREVGNEDREAAIQAPGSESALLETIDGLKQHMETLISEFETKIKVDEHKNKVIDTLHDELQGFREGIIKKHLYSFVTDVIKIIDDIRKFKNHYDSEPASEDVIPNLLTFLDSIASDLEDLFAWQGVTPFKCDSSTFENSRQRVIKKISTDDPAKDKTVAESLRPGYEWDGKMIRPELVAVYIYTNTSNGEDSAT